MAVKGKKASLIQRHKKLTPSDVQSIMADLVGADALSMGTGGGASSVGSNATGGFLSKIRPTNASGSTGKKSGASKSLLSDATDGTGKKKKRSAMEVVGKANKSVVVRDDEEEQVYRTVEEAQGLKLLNQAIKNQSYMKILDHQASGDYEYKLRRIATAGVVQLFNSIKQAQRIGEEALDETVTLSKAEEKKLVASRDAFLAALRQPKMHEI